MNLAWKIAVLTLLLNLSSGIMISLLGFDTSSIVKVDNNLAAVVDIYNINTTNSSFVDTIPVTNQVNWADNLLGLLGLGFLVDLVNLLTNYLFGIVDILLAVINFQDKETIVRIFLNTVITLVYSLALFSLFSGKNLNDKG